MIKALREWWANKQGPPYIGRYSVSWVGPSEGQASPYTAAQLADMDDD